MAYQPLTLRQVAAAIREEQASPDGDPWLWVRQFMDDFYAATPEVRTTLIAERPDLTGDPRFDAYLAALAEHFAIHYQLPIPRWVNEPERFLEQWWFPTQFKSLHAQAIVESPAAFRRRGIFVDKTEFQRC
jgi:hypothetical protein